MDMELNISIIPTVMWIIKSWRHLTAKEVLGGELLSCHFLCVKLSDGFPLLLEYNLNLPREWGAGAPPHSPLAWVASLVFKLLHWPAPQSWNGQPALREHVRGLFHLPGWLSVPRDSPDWLLWWVKSQVQCHGPQSQAISDPSLNQLPPTHPSLPQASLYHHALFCFLHK